MQMPVERPLRVRDHAVLAALVAAAYGVYEGNQLGSPRATIVAAALLILGGAALGALQGSAHALLRRLWARARRDWSPADPPERSHADTLRRIATLTAASLCGLAFLVVLWQLVLRLGAVQDPALVAALLIFVIAVGAAATAIATAFLAGFLLTPLRWLDRRLPLPFPRSAPLRLLLWFALPLGLATASLLVAHADGLKTFALGLGLVLFLVAEVAAYALWSLQPLRLRARARAGTVLAGLLALAVLALTLVRGDRPFYDTLAHAPAAGAVMKQLRRLGDLDRDGASAIFGGGDCAPFDRNRGPQSAELPGNSIDEDCDGEDGVVQPAGEVAPLERYHGRLDPALLRKYNVLWIVVDAVRADHVSALGYKKKTTPYLEFLAKESLVFTQAYSQSSATMLSIPSMLAGRHVGAVTWQKGQNRLQVDASVETFAERLKREGYRTGFVVDGYLKKNLPGMLQGFDYVKSTWLDNKTRPWNDRSAAMASAYALEFLEREHNPKKQKQPFFLTVYTADPHFTYVEHPEVPSFGRGDQARYDNEIAYSDRYIGFLIEYLRAKPPLLDNTIVIITSDHGEEFDEHGGKQHATSCYEESLHVPLFVRIPGLPAARIDARVGLNDIVPTLAELLGLAIPEAELAGQSLLLPALAPQRVPVDRPVFCTILSQKSAQGDFLRHAVRAGSDVLVRDVFEDRSELYDHSVDPDDKTPRDLSDPAARATADRLAEILRHSLTGNIETTLLTH